MQDTNQASHYGTLDHLAQAAAASADISSTRCSTCRLRKVKCSGSPAPCYNCRRLGLDCMFPRLGNRGSESYDELVSPTGTHTEAGTVRRRTVAACNECRLRKTKCTGERPTCRRCGQRNLNCIYGSERRRQSQVQIRDNSNSTITSPSTENDLMDETPVLAEPSTIRVTSTNSLNTAMQRQFLSRDVLAQHIEAYFTYIYHLPGYDIFHRPSLLEDLHNDKIPAILGTAICASVSMYISRSKESKQLSIQWAREIDTYIFSNLNNLNLLNLQILILSLFQHFVYRQFGRVWLMLGMATRLALGTQLNRGKSLNPNNSTIASRECAKRLAWSLFIQDKLHSGGVEEFLSLPQQWMHIPLPLNEDDFIHEHDHQVGSLTDDPVSLSQNGLGINGFTVILMDLRYDVLRATKSVIGMQASAPSTEVQMALTPLLKLQERLNFVYGSLPAHFTLTDRSIFSHSSTPGLTAYISLHTWFYQTFCDLYRICLPGMSRESAPAALLANAPADFVMRWQCLAVSFALKMATTWQRLLSMKGTGALKFSGELVPLDPTGCVSIHQCTKILLIARKYQLYAGLIDPISNEPTSLDDKMVDTLCQSNVAFLGDLASIAPIAAVVQQDVKSMIEADLQGPSSSTAAGQQAPVTSNTQQEKILSRYNVLAMGIAASSDSGTIDNASSSLQSPRLVRSSSITDSEYLPHTLSTTIDTSSQAEIHASAELEDSRLPAQARHVTNHSDPNCHILTGPFSHGQWEDPTALPLSSDVISNYSVAGSQFDMGGELDWFLMNGLLENYPS